MARPKGVTVPCKTCGRILQIQEGRGQRPHCATDECRLGYIVAVFREKETYDKDGHWVWDGHRRTKGNAPDICAAGPVTAKGNNTTLSYRVLDVADHLKNSTPLEGGATLRRWRNECGVKDCVALGHNVPRRAPSAPSQLIKAKLPAEPLLRLVDAKLNRLAHEIDGQTLAEAKVRLPIPKGIMILVNRAKKSGFLTVTAADIICIDFLEIHPAAVYGEDFYTAGERCPKDHEPEWTDRKGGGRWCKACSRESSRAHHARKQEVADAA